MNSEAYETDILVIGGGIGGMTAAAAAASQGASVTVVEIADEIGGSAFISRGYFSTQPTLERFLSQDPEGDAAKFRVLMADFESAIAWLRDNDVWVSPPVQGVLGFCDGYQVDMAGFFATLLRLVEGAGGNAVRRTSTEELLLEGDSVVGARCRDRASGQAITIRARATILATGGFQASESARRRFLPDAKRLVLRSNPHSAGSGLDLGLRAGASLTEPMTGFYGHLLPYPQEEFELGDIARLSFYESEFGILLERSGLRFCDESLGDHINAQVVCEIGSAVLVVDERIRRTGFTALLPEGEGSEKWAVAADLGAHYTSAPTIDELCQGIAEWGYPERTVLQSIESFNQAVAKDPEGLTPERARNREPLSEPPFHATEVQAGITFSYGGLRNDGDGRVLDGEGSPIPGLLVAGVDAGGFNRRGYSGGLVRGLVFGRRVGAAALAAAKP